MRIIFWFFILNFFHCATVFTPSRTTILIKNTIPNIEYELFCNEKLIGQSNSSDIFIVSQNEKCEVKYFLNEKFITQKIPKRWNPLYFSGVSFAWTSFSTDYFTGYHKIQPEEFQIDME